MQIEVIRHLGDLTRERWGFYFAVDHRVVLHLDSFIVEAKESTKHRKWRRQVCYDRLMKRESTIDCPDIPPDVIREAKSVVNQMINEVGVTL